MTFVRRCWTQPEGYCCLISAHLTLHLMISKKQFPGLSNFAELQGTQEKHEDEADHGGHPRYIDPTHKWKEYKHDACPQDHQRRRELNEREIQTTWFIMTALFWLPSPWLHFDQRRFVLLSWCQCFQPRSCRTAAAVQLETQFIGSAVNNWQQNESGDKGLCRTLIRNLISAHLSPRCHSWSFLVS